MSWWRSWFHPASQLPVVDRPKSKIKNRKSKIQALFERHGTVVPQKLLADAEELLLCEDPANLVQEQPGRIDSDSEVIHVFLHLLHLGG